MLTRLIAAVAGQSDFSGLGVTIKRQPDGIGEFLNALIAFVSVATAVYFLVVRPVNAVVERVRAGDTPEATTTACPQCLTEIPVAARRCSACAQPVT